MFKLKIFVLIMLLSIFPFSSDLLHGEFDYDILDYDKVKLEVKILSNYNDSQKGGISISFPQLSDNDRIIKKNKYGFDSLKSYPSRSKIWSKDKKRNISSDYLLVEGWTNNWDNVYEKKVNLLINTKNMDTLIIYIRVILRGSYEELFLPTNGETDQQGYSIKKVVIDLTTSKKKKNQYSSYHYKTDKGCSKEKPILACSPDERDTKPFAMCAVAMGGCELAISELDSTEKRLATSQACSLMSSELMGQKHELNDMLEDFFVDGLEEAATASLKSDNILLNLLGVGLAGGAIVGKAVQLDKCIAESKEICTKKYNNWKYNCK